MIRPVRGLIVATALASLAALVAGCSSSGGGGGNGNSNAPSGSSSSSSGAYSALQSVVSKLEQRPITIGITDPIKGTIPSGKTIAFIQCGAPICASLGNDLTAAASQVKWTVKRINAGLSAETIKAAWDQAVSSKPDAVVASGTPRVLFNSELTQLSALKIPVIDMTTADTAGDGITQVFGGPDQYSQQGKNMADYMLVNSGGSTVNALSVTISAYPNITLVGKGLSTEMSAQCPKCTSATLDVPGAPRVIHVPGHTPGSAALHFAGHDALFVGDAMCTYAVSTGRPGPQVAPFSADTELALASLARLEGVGAALVLPGHGEAFRGGAAEAVRLARDAPLPGRK